MDQTNPDKPTLRVFQDRGGKWRWRLRAINGRIIAGSTEDFARKNNAVRAADDFVRITKADVKVEVDE